MQGFLLVDKPGGPTSHDVVDRVRRLTGIRKVGHAGTLDPMATGLLVVAVGPVTRLISHIQGAQKEYVADVRFGIATDTLDADGVEVDRRPMVFAEADLVDVLGDFTGEILQVPPMVSALKRDGVRLHELARRGEEVDRPARPVTVHSLVVEGFESGEFPTARLRVVCGTGTYVRSLADDLAVALGGRAHLIGLRRVRIGALSVDDAVALDDLTPGDVADHLVPPALALGGLPSVTVDGASGGRVGDGRPLDRPEGLPDGPVRVLDADGRLLAVYRAEGRLLVPETVLPR